MTLLDGRRARPRNRREAAASKAHVLGRSDGARNMQALHRGGPPGNHCGVAVESRRAGELPTRLAASQPSSAYRGQRTAVGGARGARRVFFGHLRGARPLGGGRRCASSAAPQSAPGCAAFGARPTVPGRHHTSRPESREANGPRAGARAASPPPRARCTGSSSTPRATRARRRRCAIINAAHRPQRAPRRGGGASARASRARTPGSPTANGGRRARRDSRETRPRHRGVARIRHRRAVAFHRARVLRRRRGRARGARAPRAVPWAHTWASPKTCETRGRVSKWRLARPSSRRVTSRRPSRPRALRPAPGERRVAGQRLDARTPRGASGEQGKTRRAARRKEIRGDVSRGPTLRTPLLENSERHRRFPGCPPHPLAAAGSPPGTASPRRSTFIDRLDSRPPPRRASFITHARPWSRGFVRVHDAKRPCPPRNRGYSASSTEASDEVKREKSAQHKRILNSVLHRDRLVGAPPALFARPSSLYRPLPRAQLAHRLRWRFSPGTRFRHGAHPSPSATRLVWDRAGAREADGTRGVSLAVGPRPDPPSVSVTAPAGTSRAHRDAAGGGPPPHAYDSSIRFWARLLRTEYKVTYWTTLPQYKSTSGCVTRRYSDFEWLWKMLRGSMDGIIVPAPPSKTLMPNDDPGDRSAIDKRQANLSSSSRASQRPRDARERSAPSPGLEEADKNSWSERVPEFKSPREVDARPSSATGSTAHRAPG